MEGKSFDDLVQYWKRLGELRVAYLPRVEQASRCSEVQQGRRSGGSKRRNFAKMTEHTLIPLSQTADEPMMTAKFTMDELAALEGHVKKLVALAGGRGVNGARARAAAPNRHRRTRRSRVIPRGKRDGEEEEDGEGGDRKRAKTEDAPEPEPEPEPMPAPRAPSAFTGLVVRAGSRARAARAADAVRTQGTSEKEAARKKRAAGASVAPSPRRDGGSVAAAVYSSDDVTYWAPDGELLRRALEGK